MDDEEYLSRAIDDPSQWEQPKRRKRRTSEKRRLSAIVSVRLTPDEFAFVSNAAQIRGLSMSNFLRLCTLEKASQPHVTINWGQAS